MASQTLHLTKMPGLDSFYRNSIGASRMQTQQRNTKKWYQCVPLLRLKKYNLQALKGILPTHLLCNILCMLILQISQSTSSWGTMYNNPLTMQHQILRWRTYQPQWCRIRVFGLCIVDIQKSKEIQKDGHCQVNGFRRCKALPHLCSSSHFATNQRISRHVNKHPHFCNHKQQQDHTHHV